MADNEKTTPEESAAEKPAKKTAAKKTAAEKPAAEKKPAAKKTPAKKAAAEKPAAEKAAADKPAAKKAATKKAAAPKAAKVDLPGEIFDVEVNVPLIHQVVVAQQAAARQGTHSTKRRGEVRGGGRKPYKQKGTGRARQGSTRAPQFAGGGIVHGPKPRNYDQRTPKKMKAAALRGALSDRARNDRIHVLDSLISADKPSTKAALAALATVSERSNYLVVLERTDTVTWLSLRNAPQVHIVAVDQLNTYDVLASDDVIFTQGAYDAFVSGAAKSGSATEEAAK
jgi:large subunit ribosomal protein L4